MRKEYDAILVVEPERTVTEANVDKRMAGSHVDPKTGGKFVDIDDPVLYTNNSFGRQLQDMLNGIGRGYWSEVTDFGKWVSVTVGHHNVVTGRSATKTFMIVFKPNNSGLVMSSSTKWRTISGVGQAASYIRSAVSPLEYATANKM